MQLQQGANGDGDDDLCERSAVARLFELACSGATGNHEFLELDRRVRERLLAVYGTPAPED